jgi:hypothetical protein
MGESRKMRLRAELHGGAGGLGIRASPDGKSLTVTGIQPNSPVAAWNSRQALVTSIQIHGLTIVRDLRIGDDIVCVNGLNGSQRMMDEFKRSPEVLMLRFERAIGPGDPSRRATPFTVNTVLDENASKLAEDVRFNVLMEAEEGGLAYGLCEPDSSSVERLVYCAAIKGQWAPLVVATRYVDIVKEVEKRLPPSTA